MNDWKSTASSIITGLLATFGGIMTFQVPMVLLNPQQTKMWLYIVAGCQLATIIGKVWLGIITKNADASAAALALNQLASAPGTGTPFTPADLATTPKVNP